MTYALVVPTAASIKVRFPEFAATADSVIEFAIEEAVLEFNDTWTANYNLAIVYLVAHYVASSIVASASEGTGGDGDIASESIGRLSISYAKAQVTTSTTASHGDLSSTSYGVRFADIRDRNFAGPAII